VCENRVLRIIFGPKREEMAGGWRRLQNEELRNLYTIPNFIGATKSKRMRLAGYVVRMGEIRNAYKILFGKAYGKRPLGRPRSRWRIILEWILGNLGGKAWAGLVQNRDQWRAIVNTVINLRIPKKWGIS
jgi:hypothetical protein